MQNIYEGARVRLNKELVFQINAKNWLQQSNYGEGTVITPPYQSSTRQNTNYNTWVKVEWDNGYRNSYLVDVLELTLDTIPTRPHLCVGTRVKISEIIANELNHLHWLRQSNHDWGTITSIKDLYDKNPLYNKNPYVEIKWDNDGIYNYPAMAVIPANNDDFIFKEELMYEYILDDNSTYLVPINEVNETLNKKLFEDKCEILENYSTTRIIPIQLKNNPCY